MDPIQLITLLPIPAEFMVPLIIIAFGYKMWQLWILRNAGDDKNKPAVG